MIPFSDLPIWLDEQENEIRSRIAEKFTAPITEFDIALTSLEELIHAFEEEPTGLEDEIMLHPKVQSVLKTARPQTVRSLRQAMEKKPTGDPVEYYAAATDILKGVIAAAKGPGKYLHLVYKEEMPQMRRIIKEMGRAVNDMTAALSAGTKERERIQEIRSRYQRLEEIERLVGEAEDRSQSGKERETSLIKDIERAEEELAGISTVAVKEKLSSAERDLEAALQSYAQVRAPAAGVIRRAEKLLKHHKSPTDTLKPLQDLCERQVPDKELSFDLEPALQTIRSLVTSGELQLKSREEQQLFGEETLPTMMKKVSAEYWRLEDQLRQIRQEVESDPGVLEEKRLLRELDQMKKELTGIGTAAASAEEEIDRLLEEQSRLRDEMQELLGSSGNVACQFSTEDRT
jgi:predicted  nucleic acid-binding Zn-ribbon protein